MGSEPLKGCDRCSGFGKRVYSSTALWSGGIGGQQMTEGPCDKCWGSGDSERPWSNLKLYEAKMRSLSFQLAAAREVLREVRGRGPAAGGCPTCPYCGAAWMFRDSKLVPNCAPDCRLAALLREGGEDA